MKVGIMQPYFFPYIGYISLLKHTDEFILFDEVQFIRHGWIERNRILKPNEGWQYIAVPLEKHNLTTIIKDIKINNSSDWRELIFRQLQHYKKRSPYYEETIGIIRQGLNTDTDSIVKLNENILRCICKYLGIKLKIEIFSEMNLEIEKVNAPDEWALNICKAMGGVTEYWNPPGGISFFDNAKYIKENIDLKFHEINIEKYSQRRGTFEPGLSIIDVMMFNSKEEINVMLDNYQFIYNRSFKGEVKNGF